MGNSSWNRFRSLNGKVSEEKKMYHFHNIKRNFQEILRHLKYSDIIENPNKTSDFTITFAALYY